MFVTCAGICLLLPTFLKDPSRIAVCQCVDDIWLLSCFCSFVRFCFWFVLHAITWIFEWQIEYVNRKCVSYYYAYMYVCMFVRCLCDRGRAIDGDILIGIYCYLNSSVLVDSFHLVHQISGYVNMSYEIFWKCVCVSIQIYIQTIVVVKVIYQN